MLIRHGSHFTVDTIFVVLVVFVLIVMCASRLSVCYAQFTVEQEQGHGANRIGKADIDGDGHVDFTEFAETMLPVRKRRFTHELSVRMPRQMMPRRQQTDATREALDHSCNPPPIFLLALPLVEAGVFFYQEDI
ncbi:hypothetical protein AAVH_19316 [Aphelenchoides avenae]|nr:hypothetical protein AAVH_19316 [Aphelenchus avenae]